MKKTSCPRLLVSIRRPRCPVASPRLNSGDLGRRSLKARQSLGRQAFDSSLADALKKGPVVVYF